ncbi:MAG TPA: peptidase E [Candidatus Paceibacterota bacterium]|nr:peptidase E [Candidatus Paceibacterota bacterium]
MPPIQRVVAIGGGWLYVPCQPSTTLAIDAEIVRLGWEATGGIRVPRILFIPTASDDDMSYCHSVYTEFETRLGCRFDHLRLIGENLSDTEVASKIRQADIIYVGGGNTANMMRIWQERKIDCLLEEAWSKGKVLSGLSAGSICWCASGISDSEKLAGVADWKPTRVMGLGFIKLFNCPHWDSEGAWRHSAVNQLKGQLLAKNGIALEDDTALEVVGGQYRIIASQAGKVAYLLSRRKSDGFITKRRLVPHEDFRSLDDLVHH